MQCVHNILNAEAALRLAHFHATACTPVRFFFPCFGKISSLRSHQQTHCTHVRFIDILNWHNWSRTRIMMYVAQLLRNG